MNSIPILQNEERQLRLLAAQRNLYSKSKKIFLTQVAIAGPIAFISALVAICWSPAMPYVALWGAVAVLIDVLVLLPWQESLRVKAAQVQELFDTTVLDLPWNSLKAGNSPDPELVREHSENYRSVELFMPPLENWYAAKVGNLAPHVARLVCQRANCWWDVKQRRWYAYGVVFASSAILIVVLTAAMIGGLTIADFILLVVAPLAPTFVVGIRQVKEQLDAATRVDALKTHAEALWWQALKDQSADAARVASRQLQDEIFESRKRSPLVLDFIYRKLQPSLEDQMRSGVEEWIQQAEDAALANQEGKYGAS